MVVLFFPKKFILNLSPPKKLNKYHGTSQKKTKKGLTMQQKNSLTTLITFF
jgi:hypothetical protein